MYPKINISTEFTDDFEAQYLCFLAKGISMGTYQNGGYLITPKLIEGNGKTVFFPDLGYSKDFWRTINFNPNINLSTQFPSSATTEVKKLLAEYKKENYKNELEKIKTDWQKMEKPFFDEVKNFLNFDKALSKVERIDILITPFGTKGSFNPPRIGNNFNLKVTSRVDFPAGNIAAGILQNLYIIETKNGGEINDEKYFRRMSAISFLFEQTKFNKFYPEFKNIIKPDFSFPKELVELSNKYLKKLGFEVKTEIDIDNPIFTRQEKLILNKLSNSKGEIITFDQMGDILWGNNVDDKFSLEAMAKVIENLRRKIKKLGVMKEVIFTKRGEGYFIN